jgi:hypothetical protein
MSLRRPGVPLPGITITEFIDGLERGDLTSLDILVSAFSTDSILFDCGIAALLRDNFSKLFDPYFPIADMINQASNRCDKVRALFMMEDLLNTGIVKFPLHRSSFLGKILDGEYCNAFLEKTIRELTERVSTLQKKEKRSCGNCFDIKASAAIIERYGY